MSTKGIPSALVKLPKGYGVVFMEELVTLIKKGYGRRVLQKLAVPVEPLQLTSNCADAYKVLSKGSSDVWPVASGTKLMGVVSLNALKTMYRIRAAQRDSLTKV